MKKIKVLIIHNYYKISGGEDSVVENEAELLRQNGHEVILYTRHNNEINNKNIFNKINLFLGTFFSLKTFIDARKIIKKEKIDILHIHNTLPLISPSIYYCCIGTDAKIVQTLHNFRLLCPAATFTKNNKVCEACVEKNLLCSIKNKCYRNSLVETTVSALNLIIHRILGTYNRVDAFISLTEFNKKKFSKLISEQKIFVKPNFVSSQCESTGNREYFLFLGRLDELKGIMLLLNAWKGIKEDELWIVGGGPLEKNIIEFIKSNNIKNIKLLGYKDKKDVMQIISNAKALVVPSQWYEGFPMIIAESFSLGKPVISGNIGNLSEIIENEVNGLLFTYDSVNELRNCIYKINKNDKLLYELELGAKDCFNTKYNEKINYKILIDIYNKALRRTDENL